MSELEENLKKKLSVERKYVALCAMNQCAGNSPALIIALEDNEGLANKRLEEHRNRHRQHEKEMEAVLSKHRARQEIAREEEGRDDGTE